MNKIQHDQDMDDRLEKIAQALGMDNFSTDIESLIAAARQAGQNKQIPDGFVVLHKDGFLEAAEKAFHGSQETLEYIIESNTWFPVPK